MSDDLTDLPGRADARAIGLRYYRGKPCAWNHDGVRYVANKACRSCTLSDGRAYKAARVQAETVKRRERRTRARMSAPDASPMATLLRTSLAHPADGHEILI